MTIETKFDAIFSPINIGPVELKNRIALAPMNETMSGHNGEAIEQMVAYFVARAKGASH
jgi:2,4-dienoyl-CoA reductase-like NADH-dependent reductase (Old Yellow Enzyme family)